MSYYYTLNHITTKEHVKTDEHIQDVWINVFEKATLLKGLKITMKYIDIKDSRPPKTV